MTQSEIKALASEIIGDGQLPNKFFVTTGPWVTIVDRLTGVIKDVSLEKVVKIDYVQTGHSLAKMFGYEK